MLALPDNRVPTVRPMRSPSRQMPNVTAAMMSEQVSAAAVSYAAMVKPTDSASMEVATPCSSSAPTPTPEVSASSPPRSPSRSIEPPIQSSSTSAIHGTKRWNAANFSTNVWTQTQPSIGIKNWNSANVPAMAQARPRDILGSFRPFASDTENASMARPTPSKILLKKNTTSITERNYTPPVLLFQAKRAGSC